MLNLSTDILMDHIQPPMTVAEKQVHCIVACHLCEQACIDVLEQCLTDRQLMSNTSALHALMNCAEICSITGKLIKRYEGEQQGRETLWHMVATCQSVSRQCKEYCRAVVDAGDFIRVCGDVCDSCEKACTEVLSQSRFRQ